MLALQENFQLPCFRCLTCTGVTSPDPESDKPDPSLNRPPEVQIEFTQPKPELYRILVHWKSESSDGSFVDNLTPGTQIRISLAETILVVFKAWGAKRVINTWATNNEEDGRDSPA